MELMSKINRSYPCFKNSHFQNEAECETFLVKISFICVTIKKKTFSIKWLCTYLAFMQNTTTDTIYFRYSLRPIFGSHRKRKTYNGTEWYPIMMTLSMTITQLAYLLLKIRRIIY